MYVDYEEQDQKGQEDKIDDELRFIKTGPDKGHRGYRFDDHALVTAGLEFEEKGENLIAVRIHKRREDCDNTRYVQHLQGAGREDAPESFHEIFHIFRNKVTGENQYPQDKTAMKVRPQEHDEGEGERIEGCRPMTNGNDRLLCLTRILESLILESCCVALESSNPWILWILSMLHPLPF